MQGAWCSNLRGVNLQTNDHNASLAWWSTVFLKCMKFVIGFVINSSFILGKTRYDHKQKSKYNVQRVYLRPAYYKLWGRCRWIYENVIYVDKSQASREDGILKLSSIRGDAFCAGLRKYAFHNVVFREAPWPLTTKLCFSTSPSATFTLLTFWVGALLQRVFRTLSCVIHQNQSCNLT